MEVNDASPLWYQWLLDGHELADATNATLSLRAVQPGDAGSYRVRVSNSFGTVLSNPAELVVLAAPVLAQAGTPAADVSVYAVEEEVPAGVWVTNLSEGGVFDAVTRKVKFGPASCRPVRGR